MTLPVSDSFKNRVAEPEIQSFIAVYLDFESGGVWVSTASREIHLPADGDIPAVTPIPLGNAMSVGRLNNKGDALTQKVALTVEGVTGTMVGLALTENIKGRYAYFQQVLINHHGLLARGDLFVGVMETIQVIAGEQGAVRINIGDWLSGFGTASNLSYSDADQQVLRAGDTVFAGAEDFGDMAVNWGR
ncbi:MAG: hypothetical protein J4F41_00245 [Alphaproteobacteria bacterium]|nr:hypothetical protein [Alphaproteobacteria bacterium]